ncbi:MAG TPA: DICT sensory domain-containing protein [Leptolyngbyaceae cyanobacterium]
MLEGSILKRLMLDHSTGGQTPLNFGVYYKNTLVALCHALEDCILASECAPLVITAFQRGKWYLQEAERYSAIADRARQIVIMAAADAGFHEHPTSQRENVALVDLAADDPVAEEWHLMILSPNYTAMVLCQELRPEEYGPSGPPQNDLERKFYGLWTFEPALVQEAMTLAISHIDHYNPALQQQLTQHLNQIHQDNPELENSDGFGQAVTQVVSYLQSCRHDLMASDAFNLVEDLNQNLTSNELQAFLRMAQLVDLSDPVNPLGADEVSSLLEMMGQLLDLPAWQLRRLRLAGLLYRIAPTTAETPATAEEAPSCPLVPGAQALRTMPRLRAVAAIITHQSEAWDGSGQPAGLKGDQIPLESRMLGLVIAFQSRLAELRFAASQSAPSHTPAETVSSEFMGKALEACQSEQGQKWDPKLVELLSLMVKGLQQGFSLPTLPTKFRLGTGLLNVDDEEPAVLPLEILSS